MSYAPPSHWAIPYPQHAPPIQPQAGYANVVQHAPVYPPAHYASVPPAAAPPYGYPPVDAKGPDHPGYTVAAQPYAPQAMGAQPAATLYQTGLGTTAACTHGMHVSSLVGSLAG
jgi:hypothetical protein